MKNDSFRDLLEILAWKQYLLNADTKLVADASGDSFDSVLDKVDKIYNRIEKIKSPSK